MRTINIKIYLVLVLILFVIMFLTYVILPQLFKNKKENVIFPTISPIPTSTKMPSKKNPSPTLIPPTDFTGVKEEELPPDIKNLSEQKQILKSRVPFSENLFSIDFNYEEDKFIIELKEPKNQSKTAFENWLRQNYPAIPLDRFIFK